VNRPVAGRHHANRSVSTATINVKWQHADGVNMSMSQLRSTRTFVTKLIDALSVRASGEHGAAEGWDGNQNPLEAAGGDMKKQMLALHVAFPNELLPALDLLDRSLITRLRIRRDNEDQPEGAAPQERREHVEGTHAGGAQGNDNSDGRIADAPAQHLLPSDGVGPTEASDAEMLDVSPQSALPDRSAHKPPQDVEDKVTDKIYYVRSAQQRSSRYSTSFDTLTSYEVRLGAWNCSCPAFAFSAFSPIHPEPPVPTYEPGGEIQTEQGAWIFGGVSLGEGMPPVCKHLLACVLAEQCADLFGRCVEERLVNVEEAAGWAAGWGD
jgi:hypothetical protein